MQECPCLDYLRLIKLDLKLKLNGDDKTRVECRLLSAALDAWVVRGSFVVRLKCASLTRGSD